MQTLERNGSTVIFVAAAFWWAVFLSMHVLQPGLDPVRAPGSAYVLGDYGIWVRATYYALAAALLAAAFSLSAHVRPGRALRLGRIAFSVAAAASAVNGIFAIDYPGPPQTVSGIIHAIGGAVGFLSWVTGTLLFTAAIRRDAGWSRVRGAVTGLAAAAVLVVLVAIGSLATLGFAGYAQRLYLAISFSWLIVVAIHLRRSAPSPVVRPAV